MLRGAAARKVPAEKRFAMRVKKQPGCWLWVGPTDRGGYGHIVVNGKRFKVHRYSYTVNIGAIPKGMLVCHTCDNPSCVKPKHLFLGKHDDNAKDMVSKGRQNRGSERPASKLTEDVVRYCRSAHSSGSPESSVSKLARKFGVSESVMCTVLKNKAWRHVK